LSLPNASPAFYFDAAAVSVSPTSGTLRWQVDTEVIDFFAPPRDDFLLGGKPAYMGQG
jgi:hypothetical protein